MKLVTSGFGTFRTCPDVRLESAFGGKSGSQTLEP